MPGSFSLGIDDVLRHDDKLMNGNRERKILLNSWEGVYLNIKEPEMAQMMADIKSMGVELFVMDDGWFGGKYKRSIDNSPLAFEGKTFSGEYLMQNGQSLTDITQTGAKPTNGQAACCCSKQPSRISSGALSAHQE